MKPKDVNTQIFSGVPSGWDQNDTMSFNFYEVQVAGIDYEVVEVDYETGIVRCYNGDDVIAKYAIKATLEPITES